MARGLWTLARQPSSMPYPQPPFENLMRIDNQTLWKYLHKLTLYIENV